MGCASHISSTLITLAGMLDMHPISDVKLYRVPICPSTEYENDGGMTAVLPITTSHITIHTWPVLGRARVIIDSCKPFDAREASLFLSARFRAMIVQREMPYHDWG
jgi:S-adenosylmethionine/arginine decarboxylase-like enzyme